MSSLWTPGGERPVGREPTPEAPAEAPYGDIDDIDEAELQDRLGELREQLAHTPVEGIVAQVAYQFFEVAALHLSLRPAQLPEAQLAIDAMAALVEGLGERLGENAAPLRDGLSQIRMAFVQIKQGAGAEPTPPNDPADPEPPQS
ncbi:MAG TPA: hypothetical protein VFB78_11990 [Acidimicrobiales bacterium]|nr:hypothetical protein [Acidimicrobiales bacterium]